jgi:hypothetical protein
MQVLTGVESMSGYEQYNAKMMQQRDDEEGIALFPEQQYGMGHLPHHYPLEQYLDSYWRHFHPTFPVVHRFTEAMSRSPMLHAAMVAIGGQYSSDSSVQTKSKELYEQCVKLLERVWCLHLDDNTD